MRESEIQYLILSYLRDNNIFVWRNYVGSIRIGNGRNIPNPSAGAPDLIGVLPDGRFLGIEVKTPAGKLSPKQAAFLGAIKKAGGVAFVATSIGDIDRFLKDYLNDEVV